MQKLSLYSVLAIVFIWCNSFTPEGYRDSFKSEGSLHTTVNGQGFQLREKDFYRAMLVAKPNPFSTSFTDRYRTVTSLIIYGNDTADAGGKAFSESITIEYTFSPTVMSDAGNVSFEMSYNYGNYYLLPETGSFKVTAIDWSADKTSFALSGQYECDMHRHGYSDDEHTVVKLKGEVSGIQVTVPPWVAAKLNTQASIEQ